MKLYNKTKCPEKILTRLLTVAGRSVKARTSRVVVKVTQGQKLTTKGSANRGLPYQWHLKRVKRQTARVRLIASDCGWIEITLPKLYSGLRMKCWPNVDAVTLARRFYKTAQHEWAHIRDFQQRNYVRTPVTSSGRRICWAARPCEISAMAQVDDAQELNIDSIILDLALWIETQQNQT